MGDDILALTPQRLYMLWLCCWSGWHPARVVARHVAVFDERL